MDKPLISVVIPTYNEEKYIGDLLKSIKKQTYKNYEVIIGDYKSKDRTREIARKYGAKIASTNKKGFSEGKNAGLKKAKGEIIAFIDADFTLSKRVFEEVVETFEKYPDVIAVQPRVFARRKALPYQKYNKFKIFAKMQNLISYFSFMTSTPQAAPCVFLRSFVVKKVGGFDENIDILEDIDFYRRTRKFGKYRLINAKAGMCMRRLAKHGIAYVYLFKYFPAAIYNSLKLKTNKIEYNPIR